MRTLRMAVVMSWTCIGCAYWWRHQGEDLVEEDRAQYGQSFTIISLVTNLKARQPTINVTEM